MVLSDSKGDGGFLDCFYGLASSDAEERSQSGQVLMEHLLKEDNEEDGLYALKRLCEGLCSGRACARQGYASALSLMVQCSYKEKLAWTKSTSLPTLRTKLIQYTSTGEGADKKKKKGREERDVYFGRLFGILAMIRSQTLTTETTLDYTNDLISLYQYKFWMREPSIKAIMDLFSSLLSTTTATDQSHNHCQQLVDTLLLPFITSDEDLMTAEKYALLWHLQGLNLNIPKSMQFSLALLTQTNSTLFEVMQGTSRVVPPRCHILWTSVLQLLHLSKDDDEIKRIFMNKFVYEQLLHVNVSTNERRALALTLIERSFAAFDSVDWIFVDVSLPSEKNTTTTATTTTNSIVERAFIHKKNSMLEPMAQTTLQQIIQHCSLSVTKRWTLLQQMVPYEYNEYHVPLLFSDIFSSEKENNILIWNSYITYVQEQLERIASSSIEQNENKDHLTRTYIDHLYHFAKRLYHLHKHQQHQQKQEGNTESPMQLFHMVQRILSLLFLYACVPFPKLEIKTDEESHSNNGLVVIQTANKIKLTMELPYSVRSMALSRLQSLYLDTATVSFVYDCWSMFLQRKVSLYQFNNEKNHDGIIDIVFKKDKAQQMEPLLQLVSLQLLTAGTEEEDDDDDDDNDNEDVLEMVQDLSNLEESDFLSELTQICVHLLSSHWATKCKYLRDLILQTWTQTAKNFSTQLDASAMTILLEAVCGSDTLAETMPEDDDEEEESENEEDAVFASAANLQLSDNEDESNNDDSSESSKEEEEVELNASQTEDMLLEDDIDEGDLLEHHAGADKALAQLLRVKQQSRKSGQEEQEKKFTRQRLFCIGFLERIFTSKYNILQLENNPAHHQNINTLVGISVLPLLRARRVLETKQNNSISTNNSTVIGAEHSSLLKRLTSLLQNIFKVKLPGTADIDGCQVVTRSILEQEFAPSRSKVHIQLCQDALRFYIRAVQTPSELAKQIYSDTIITEWTTHKRSKFTASTIQDFISRCPIVSRSQSTSLIPSILHAFEIGRSPFIQFEAICILSQLYDLPSKYYQDENATAVITVLEDHLDKVISSLQSSIQSPDIIKGKRIKDVLKAFQNIVTFISKNETKREHYLALDLWCEPLKSIHDASASTNVQKTCQSILKTVSNMVQQQKEKDAEMTAETAARELLQMEEDKSTTPKTKASSKKNKSTSKKKKKKSKR